MYVADAGMKAPRSGPMVRAATEADVARLVPVWEGAWHDAHDGRVPSSLLAARGTDHFSTYATTHLSSINVAIAAGECVLGVIIVDDDTGEVVQLAVDRAARGQGIGGRLLRTAEDRLSRRRAEAWLAVVPGNLPAQRLYERHGWRDTGPMIHAAPTRGGSVPVPVRRYVKRLSVPIRRQ